jgi:CTP:molybdopterin cytidylyltransferase MocA
MATKPGSAPGRIAAVVAAAGRSERFGSDKLCFPIDGRAVLERVISSLRAGGADPVIVVTGPEHRNRARLARSVGAQVDDRDPPPGSMLESLVRGLELAPAGPALLCPADLPFLAPETVAALLAAAGPSGRAVLPTRLGRRGHPILVSAVLRERIPKLDPAVGLRQLLRDAEGAFLRLEVDDSGIRRDVDYLADIEVSSR